MYNLKIVYSGSDRVEIYKINNYVVRDKLKIEEQRINSNTGSNKQSLKDRQKTLRDSRNNIIRLIKSNPDMTTFITLTFAENTDYKLSKKYINNIFNKLRRDYESLKYLWVLEYGELNGRLHYHMLCNMPISVKLSSSKERKSKAHKKLENEFAKKYWKYGFVDIRSLSQEDNTNIALYVSTYIVKSLELQELEGFRIYGYSNKTLEKPIEEKYYTNTDIEVILKRFTDIYSIAYTNSYSIGFTDWKGEHSGNVEYFDLNLKE